MRTRFLNTDYFSPSSFLTETLTFFNLPVPHLSSSRLLNFHEDFLEAGSFVDNSLDIQRLPIDSALSNFFHEVVPQAIDFDCGDLEAVDGCIDDRNKFGSINGCTTFELEAMVGYQENGAGSWMDSGPQILESGIYEDNTTIADSKDKQRFEAIEFETPELEAFLDNACSHDEEMEIFSEISEMEYSPEELNNGHMMQYHSDIQESVFSVEDLTSSCYMDINILMPEEDNYFGDQVLLQDSTYPILEVDEINPGSWAVFLEGALLSALEAQFWTQKVDLLVDSKELLGLSEYDLLEFLSNNCLSRQFPEPEMVFPDMFVDLDSISMVEIPQTGSTFDQSQPDGYFNWSKSIMIFEEFQFFYEDPSQPFEDFLNGQIINKHEQCDCMSREEWNLKNFNELIVSHELALVDGTFKSLPVPVLFSHKRIKLQYDIVEEFLSELEQLPFSASDGIYLDWHILEANKYCGKTNSSFLSKVNEIDCYSIESEWESMEDRMLVFDFIFSDGASNGSITERQEESPNTSCDDNSVPHGNSVGISSGGFPEKRCSKPGSNEHLVEKYVSKASLPLKSMLQFNDLDSNLNPQDTIAAENVEFEDAAVNLRTKLSGVPSEGQSSTGVQLQEWDVMFYNIKLSDDVVALISDFEKSYLAILSNETELNAFFPADNFKLISLPKQNLIECIKKKMTRRHSSSGDEEIMAFVVLCAIKQMAWYTCIYGIHVAYLYVERLCQSLSSLRSRLDFPHTLLEHAHGKVIKEITRSHPSLSVIQGILQSNSSQGTSKVLILAEELLWCSLKIMLMSMGLSCQGLTFDTNANQAEASRLDVLLVSDCLLVSPEHVSASFPFSEFNLILEYGGSSTSSRIPSLSPKLAPLPRLHFINVQLDDFSASKAFCDSVDMPQNNKLAGECHSMLATDNNLSDQYLEQLLNFIPVEDNFNDMAARSGNKTEGHCMPVQDSLLPLAGETKQTQKRMMGTIIIVNTQNLDKEMIISRRSAYQKILAMEKEGAQVLERDSDLPVDIIVSSSICLVWYDFRNIGKKATTSTEASFGSPFCLENIATNVLTSLSFAFSGCFLVFEGETSFLSMGMEFSDGLYSAAASLGIDLQLFHSYSSEITDDIILYCIEYAAKFTHGLYPKMPESETLAESFLTKFTSINPLTAHAILSSVEMLIQFLEWSPESRIRAMKDYLVPDECVTLFSTLCKYGEKEDSKSILTDSSSSGSSGAESDNYCLEADYKRKRPRYTCSPHTIDLNMDDLLHFELANKCSGNILNLSALSRHYDSSMSAAPNILQDHKDPNLSSANVFGREEEFDFSGIMNDFKVPKQDGSHVSKRILNHDQCQNINSSENWHEDLSGEVINIHDSPLLGGEDFPSISNLMDLSFLAYDEENDPTRNPRIRTRLSVGKSSALSFQGTNDHIDRGRTTDSVQVNLFESASNHGETPLSKAIRTAQQQPGSPWTIEFLNRIREKSRQLQKSLPPVTSSPCFGMPISTSKVTKRRSPSILEFFKYKGGITPSPRKRTEQKKQKKSLLQSSSTSKIEKASDYPLTWTPIDKRARQKLSFVVGENGSQTKLLWSDGDTCSLSKKLRNQ